MALALDEDHCGVAADIVYPNVQSCIALAIGTAGGTLAGMHLTVGTSAAQIQRAAQAMATHMVGTPDSIVCIGHTSGFKTAVGGLIFPGVLRQTLLQYFGNACTVNYFDTSPLYEATKAGAFGGVVVRAWRDGLSHKLRYAVGAHTVATKGAKQAAPGPWFKISTMRTTDLTGKQQDSYTLAAMSDIPALGLATM